MSQCISSFPQYDIDGDGMLDILFVTSSGDLMFFTPNGTAIKDKFFEVGDDTLEKKEREH